jgi:hypothetical protein
MRVSQYMLASWVALVAATGIPTAAMAAPVRAVSYVGGSGDETITGGDLLADGTIVLGGSSTSPQLLAAETRLEPGDGFVGWWNQDVSQLTRVVRLGAVAKLLQRPDGQLIVASGKFIKGLRGDGSAIAFTSEDVGAAITDLAIAGDGYVAIAGTVLVGFDAAGKVRFRTTIGRSKISALTADATYAYVGGDQNTNTGFEPYRSPYVFRYRLTDGTADANWKMYNWAGPDVRANGKMLQADSFVNELVFDPSGQLWLAGGSDGGNTVLTKSASNLDTDQPALTGACYPGPCFNYKGARKTGMFGRIKRDVADLERASWVIPYLSPKDGRNSPACGCKAPPANPNSATIEALAFSGDTIVAAATSSYRPPESDNAWFRDTLYTGFTSWIGIFDRDVKSISMATMVPGTKGPAGVVVRGGRVLLFGDSTTGVKPATVNPGEENWAYALPTTPTAAQKAFGGGKSDGYLLLACIGTDAECGAPPGGPTPPVGTTPNPVPTTPGGTPTGPAASAGNEGGCGCHVQSAPMTGAAGTCALALLAMLVRRRSRRNM